MIIRTRAKTALDTSTRYSMRFVGNSIDTSANSKQALVVVCLDGCDPDYLHAARTAGAIPWMTQQMANPRRYHETLGAMPSFTNPNNAGILTGGPPSWHGLAGNFGYDAELGREVATSSPEWLTAPSLLAKAHATGCPAVVVTAKDKLLRLLCHGLPTSAASVRSVSLEAAAASGSGSAAGIASARVLDNVAYPRPWPTIYEPACSVAVLQAGAALVDSLLPSPRPVVAFLSTTDYVQHKAGPRHPLALDFISRVDAELASMDKKGWALAVTADHGMNDKADPVTGSPRVAWLSTALRSSFIPARVSLPITDAHVTHHGALGGFAYVHLGGYAVAGKPMPAGDTPAGYAARVQVTELLPRAIACLKSLPGVDEVLTRGEAIRALQLPTRLVGDLVVLSTKDAVLGKSPEEHDQSAVSGAGGMPRLRSHGARYDARVPLLMNWDYMGQQGEAGSLRNWHALSVLLQRHDVLGPQDVPGA